jgi:chromosome segregation ATPase
MMQYEQGKLQHEQRMKQHENDILQVESDILRVRKDSEQIKKETEQIERETEQLRRENAKLRQAQRQNAELAFLRRSALLSARVQLDPSDLNRARLQTFLALISGPSHPERRIKSLQKNRAAR